MKQKKGNPTDQISRLQFEMVAATIAGDTEVYKRLNRRYNKLVKDIAEISIGGKAISPIRDAIVVKRLLKWDRYLSAGRIREAEKLIPAEADSHDVYESLPSVVSKYGRGTMSITENSDLHSGDAVDRSPEYLRGEDGTLEYFLYLDGKESQIRAIFAFETYGKAFGLFVRSIERA